MKKRLITKLVVISFGLVVVVLFAVICYSDDMEDLQNERQSLINRLNQYEQTITNIRTRIVELNGIIGFLHSKEKTEQIEPEKERITE